MGVMMAGRLPSSVYHGTAGEENVSKRN